MSLLEKPRQKCNPRSDVYLQEGGWGVSNANKPNAETSYFNPAGYQSFSWFKAWGMLSKAAFPHP